MQVNSPSSSRAAWYDRNPSMLVLNYQASSIAPHAETIRWSYIVPSGRKAIIEAIVVHLIRTTVATSINEYGAYVRAVLPNNYNAQVRLIDTLVNTQYYNVNDEFAGALTLFEADTLQAVTYDGSTGGTVSYYLAHKGTEFDA